MWIGATHIMDYQEKVFTDRVPAWASDCFKWHPSYGWFFDSEIAKDGKFYYFQIGFPGANTGWGVKRTGKTE